MCVRWQLHNYARSQTSHHHLKEFKPTYKKYIFHEIEMGHNEFSVRSGMAKNFYSMLKSDVGRLL